MHFLSAAEVEYSPRRSRRRTACSSASRPTPGSGRGRSRRCGSSDSTCCATERGEKAKGQAAKQVCADCQVQQQCRDLAVRAASSQEEDHGIFAATTPRSSVAGFAATPAPARASGTPTGRRPRRRTGWRSSWDRSPPPSSWAPPPRPWPAPSPSGAGLPRPAPRLGVRPRPRQGWGAFALAERLGSVKAAARELGSSRPALVAGWRRFGLGMPDTSHPVSTRPGARPAGRGEPAGRLDPVFVTLNESVLPVRAGSEAERLAGPPRRGVRHPGRRGSGRAVQREPLGPSVGQGVGDHPPRSARPDPRQPAADSPAASARRPRRLGPPRLSSPAAAGARGRSRCPLMAATQPPELRSAMMAGELVH
jgi:Transcription factor WhiB